MAVLGHWHVPATSSRGRAMICPRNSSARPVSPLYHEAAARARRDCGTEGRARVTVYAGNSALTSSSWCRVPARERWPTDVSSPNWLKSRDASMKPRLRRPAPRARPKRNGAIAQIFSAADPDSLRGPQFAAAWCDELAKWRYAEETWDIQQRGSAWHELAPGQQCRLAGCWPVIAPG
jgi:hypothetical protein